MGTEFPERDTRRQLSGSKPHPCPREDAKQKFQSGNHNMRPDCEPSNQPRSPGAADMLGARALTGNSNKSNGERTHTCIGYV